MFSMYELRRRWKDPSFKCPLATAVIASPLKIFWKQALQAVLLAVAVGLLGMSLLLFIPNTRDQKLNEPSDNRSLKDIHQMKLIDILFFSKINYWRGNWAADNLFAYMATCKSDLKMLTLKGENYTEDTIRNVGEIEFFYPSCTTSVFGFSNYQAITWHMHYHRISTFWTERTPFGHYNPVYVTNNEKFRSRIVHPHLCRGSNCFVTAVPKKRNNFRILVQDKNEKLIIISDKRNFLFCGVQDTNTENYVTFGSGYKKHHPIFLNENNICLYVCFDMADGPFSYEHPYVYYGKSNGAILMKPNTRYISKLSLHLFKIDEENLYAERFTNKETEVQLPKEIDPRSYFVGCQWFDDWATVAITSRNFQITWYLSCTYQKSSGKCEILWIKDWVLTKGYSDILSAGFNDGEKLITVTPSGFEKQTSKVVMIDRKNMNVYPLTPNYLFVTELIRWDKVNENVYYIAASVAKPGERHLYKSHFLNKIDNCLTCTKSTNTIENDEQNQWPTCHYSSVQFSPRGSYYLLDCLDDKGDLKNMPETFIVSTKSNRIVKRLDKRKSESKKYKTPFSPIFRFFECPIAGGKYYARIKLQIPPEFQSNKKYSLIFGVDSRIGSQQVSRKWKVDVGTYASVKKKYIYGVADVRGSGYQGYEFESELYKNIGNPEVEDLLQVIHWLLDKLPYIDSENVFVQGEQYGGMVAVLMALKEPNLIKAVAAYHPPLFWIGTSAFFAERLLGLPTLQDNYYGYEAKSIGEHVYRYRDMKILIVMDMSTSSAGHSQQLSMMRDNMNEQPFHFNFMNVIELCYETVIERARHRITYYQMMFHYFEKFRQKK